MMEPIEIPKKQDEVIRIARTEYKGHQYIDIRQYYQDDAGEFKPTRKGVTFPPELLDEVIDGLNALSKLPVPED